MHDWQLHCFLQERIDDSSKTDALTESLRTMNRLAKVRASLHHHDLHTDPVQACQSAALLRHGAGEH
jgi:hypothetical protein